MAFVHGKSALFKLDNGNSTPTLTDISAYISDISFPRQLDTPETTTFGNSAKTYLTGLADSSISISGMYDATLDANLQTAITNLQAGTISILNFQYQTNSGAVSSTNPKWTGTCIIKSYEIKSAVADVVSFSLELQVSGAITRATS